MAATYFAGLASLSTTLMPLPGLLRLSICLTNLFYLISSAARQMLDICPVPGTHNASVGLPLSLTSIGSLPQALHPGDILILELLSLITLVA